MDRKQFHKILGKIEGTMKPFGFNSSVTIHGVKIEDVPGNYKEHYIDEGVRVFRSPRMDLCLFVRGNFKQELEKRKHLLETFKRLDEKLKEDITL
jgi:hypothetical protein